MRAAPQRGGGRDPGRATVACPPHRPARPAAPNRLGLPGLPAAPLSERLRQRGPAAAAGRSFRILAAGRCDRDSALGRARPPDGFAAAAAFRRRAAARGHRPGGGGAAGAAGGRRADRQSRPAPGTPHPGPAERDEPPGHHRGGGDPFPGVGGGFPSPGDDPLARAAGAFHRPRSGRAGRLRRLDRAAGAGFGPGGRRIR